MIVANFFPGIKSVETQSWANRSSSLGPMSNLTGSIGGSAEYDARRRRRVWERDSGALSGPLSDVRGDVRGLIWPDIRGGYGQVAESAGAAAAVASREYDVAKSIFIGTSTGILVWLMTRFIDKQFGLGMGTRK